MSEVEAGPVCGICGEPMPAGQEMFKYHGYDGNPCPKSPLPKPPSVEAQLLAALKLARAYLDVSLGSPSWTGENPYPVIDAAIARAEQAAA